MSIEVTTAQVQQYKNNVFLLSQQKGSRLRSTVSEDTCRGKTAYFERIGGTIAHDRTSRHADTTYTNTPHSRRRVALKDKEWADLVDPQDLVRMLINPTSSYVTNGSYAMGRSIDDEIISAARGNAYGGEDGSTVIPLPSAQKVAASATGLTVAKILEAQYILDSADVDPDEERYMIVTAKQIQNALNLTEVKSADYNTVKALAEGKIDTFASFKFLRTQRLPKVSTSRFCLAYVKSGMGLAVGQDLVTSVDRLPTKGNSMQVLLQWTMGATRIEDEKVVEIECIE
jgi:hypothetical protein